MLPRPQGVPVAQRSGIGVVAVAIGAGRAGRVGPHAVLARRRVGVGSDAAHMGQVADGVVLVLLLDAPGTAGQRAEAQRTVPRQRFLARSRVLIIVGQFTSSALLKTVSCLPNLQSP